MTRGAREGFAPPGAAAPAACVPEIATLGERVRALRKRRRVTRRELARLTSISERYLADLEGGKANISIALIARVAAALETNLAALVTRNGGMEPAYAPLGALIGRLSPEQQRDAYRLLSRHLNGEAALKGIALIGLRGAGKTTLGRRLAEKFNVPFLRLSNRVEELAGMAVPELMELGGEKAYRRYENMALSEISASAGKVVLEAGGGLVNQDATYAALLQRFKVVWIRAAPEEHMARVIAQGDMRPMAGNTQAMQDLRSILAEREPGYRRADYTLDTANRTVEECLAELSEVCEPTLAHPGGPAATPGS